MKKRPIGLTVFAIINFILAGLATLSLLAMISSRELREQAGASLSVYAIVSPLLTITLLTTSGIGFLRLSLLYGYIGGVAFTVLSLLNILIYNAFNGFSGFALHIPSMIYPTLLLFFLIFRYKSDFTRDTKNQTHQNGGQE